MARQIRITKTQVLERNFACEHCGAFGVVTVKAVGSSGWRREGWFNRDQAASQASEDAGWAVMHDADRIVSLIRCPTCRERAPRATFWSRVRMIPAAVVGFLLGSIGGGAIAAVLLGRAGLPWALGAVASVGIGGVGAWLGASDELRRLREAGGAAVMNLRPGSIAKTLPRAEVKRLPQPAPSPQPLAPLRTAAPEQVERAADDAGPRFLKEG